MQRLRRRRRLKKVRAIWKARIAQQQFRQRMFKTIDKLPRAYRDLINEYDYDAFVRLYKMADGDMKSLRRLLEYSRAHDQEEFERSDHSGRASGADPGERVPKRTADAQPRQKARYRHRQRSRVHG
uniref:Uncharacterized protein n=1 Tax=Caulobacter phage BL57 TaxID=3348355 RepID=A0AB74UGS8_9VIRU